MLDEKFDELLDNQQSIKQLKAKIVPILKGHGVEQAYIFGSRARGEAATDSDLDLLVRYHQPKTFFEIHALTSELEQAVGLKVDLVSDKGLKENVFNYIKKEMKPVMPNGTTRQKFQSSILCPVKKI